MEPKPWLDKIKKKKWKIHKKDCRVIRGEYDNDSGNYWWKVKVLTPELWLETPNLFTVDYANDFIAMITASTKPSRKRRLISMYIRKIRRGYRIFKKTNTTYNI